MEICETYINISVDGLSLKEWQDNGRSEIHTVDGRVRDPSWTQSQTAWTSQTVQDHQRSIQDPSSGVFFSFKNDRP